MAFESAKPVPTYIGTYAPNEEKPNPNYKQVLPNESVTGFFKETYSTGEGEEKRTNHVFVDANDEHLVINGTAYLTSDLERYASVGVLTRVTYLGRSKSKKGKPHTWNIELDRTQTKTFNDTPNTDSAVSKDALSNNNAPITDGDIPF